MCCVCCSDAIAVKQSQVDKLYASLKDLALERRDKLGEVLKLYKLNREIEDLEQWIAEREVVAGSHELGQDFEHVTVIYAKRGYWFHETNTSSDMQIMRKFHQDWVKDLLAQRENIF